MLAQPAESDHSFVWSYIVSSNFPIALTMLWPADSPIHTQFEMYCAVQFTPLKRPLKVMNKQAKSSISNMKQYYIESSYWII